MMRKILFYTFIILSYHLLLIILPVLLFITSLTLANQSLLNLLPWLYGPFLLLSPLITIYLSYLAIRDKMGPFSWMVPIIMSLAGNLPFFLSYCLFSSLVSQLDYSLFIGLPVLWGLLADFTAYNYNLNWLGKLQQLLARIKSSR